MACDVVALCIEALDPVRVGRFWADLLGAPVTDRPGGAVEVSAPDDRGWPLRFVPSSRPKAGQNLMHLDLTSSSPEHRRSTVDTSLRLGAAHADVGQRGDEGHVVLADVEDNEFCVIEPGNAFLADCGPVGALACDGSEHVGRFWAAALGWPLVWDRDEETAIQAPGGGPKISWGGPPLMPRTTTDRFFLEIAPTSGSHVVEVERLLSLGATRRTGARPSPGAVDLSDPDGNLFRVVAHA